MFLYVRNVAHNEWKLWNNAGFILTEQYLVYGKISYLTNLRCSEILLARA